VRVYPETGITQGTDSVYKHPYSDIPAER